MRRAGIMLLLITGAGAALASWPKAPEPVYQPRSGDLIFQREANVQSAMIKVATLSRYNHVGIVFVERGKPYVYEAIGRVVKVPLKDFIKRGSGAHFIVRRLKEPLPSQAQVKLRRETRRHLGKRYDPMLSWDDSRMYCSELVWKVYKRALGLEISPKVKIRDFAHVANGPVMWALKKAGPTGFDLSKIKWDESLVAPGTLLKSSALHTVYGN